MKHNQSTKLTNCHMRLTLHVKKASARDAAEDDAPAAAAPEDHAAQTAGIQEAAAEQVQDWVSHEQ